MTAPLRLVHVDQETGFSGGEAQVVGLVEGLRERGHDCLVVGPESGKLAERGTRLGWCWRDWSVRADADVGAVFRLARLLREERADLVHLHTGRAAWIGGWAARRAGVPSIVTRRQDKPLKGWKHRAAYVRNPAATAAISPAIREQLLELGAEPEWTPRIWSSVNPQALAPSRSREELRAGFGLAPGTLAIAVLASLVTRKGIDVLLAALEAMSTAREVTVLIGGSGPERERLEEQAERLPGRRTAQFLGQVDRPGDVLGSADAACLPSRAEGLGVAALEAMAVGVPLVATAVGGLEAAVGSAGLIAPPDDPRALAQALDRLADDAGLAASLGRAARERVRTEFLFPKQITCYEELYRRVLERLPR